MVEPCQTMAASGMAWISPCPPSPRQVASWEMFSISFIPAAPPPAWFPARRSGGGPPFRRGSAILHGRQIHAPLARGLDGQLVAGIGVAHDAGARIGGEHPLEAAVAGGRAVGDRHHAGVDRVPD